MSHGKLKITSFLLLMLSGSILSAIAGFFICAAVNNGGFKALGSLSLKEMSNRYSPIATILGFFVFETISLIVYVIIHGDELAKGFNSTSNDDSDTVKEENITDSVPLPNVDINESLSDIPFGTDSEHEPVSFTELVSDDIPKSDADLDSAVHIHTSDINNNDISESEKIAEAFSDEFEKDSDECEENTHNDLDYLLGISSKPSDEEIEQTSDADVVETVTEDEILSDCSLEPEVVSRLRENDTYSPEQIMAISKVTDYLPSSDVSYNFIIKMFGSSLSADDISDRIVTLYG